MKEYIEKAAVKDEILSWAVCINHPELLSKEDTMHCIDNMPSANVAEVVRCRECVNNIPDGNGKPYCRWLELYIKDLNFFCRDGQRKIETVLPINDTKDESLEETHANTRKNAR